MDIGISNISIGECTHYDIIVSEDHDEDTDGSDLSNFVTSDSEILKTSDGQIFNVQEPIYN